MYATLFIATIFTLILTPSDAFLKIGKKRDLHSSEQSFAREIRSQIYNEMESMAKGMTNLKRIIDDVYTIEGLAEEQNSHSAREIKGQRTHGQRKV